MPSPKKDNPKSTLQTEEREWHEKSGTVAYMTKRAKSGGLKKRRAEKLKRTYMQE